MGPLLNEALGQQAQGERRPSPWGASTPGASGGPREQWPAQSQGQAETPTVLRPLGQLDPKAS